MAASTLKPLYVLDGVRTPFVKAGGAFEGVAADELGRLVAREVMLRATFDPARLAEVIFGCVGQTAKAANVARVIALRSGVPESVPAYTVHRNCASGSEAIVEAMLRMNAGLGDAYLVGGTESMSNYPLAMSKKMIAWLETMRKADGFFARLGRLLALGPAELTPEIWLLQGLTDPVCGQNMGVTAENIASDFGIGRAAQDAFALASHQRAAAAVQKLREETMDVVGSDGKLIRDDQSVRGGQTLADLAALKPAFEKSHGTVTAGNACPVSDGACALLVGDEAAMRASGGAPLGRVRAFATAGLDPSRMGLGPVHAIARLLDQTQLSLADIKLVEINEAFAAQVLGCRAAATSADYAKKKLGGRAPIGDIPEEKLNVNGGALALGHPVGASGARLVLTLLKELKRRGGGLGIASLCIGGGQGTALLVEA